MKKVTVMHAMLAVKKLTRFRVGYLVRDAARLLIASGSRAASSPSAIATLRATGPATYANSEITINSKNERAHRKTKMKSANCLLTDRSSTLASGLAIMTNPVMTSTMPAQRRASMASPRKKKQLSGTST